MLLKWVLKNKNGLEVLGNDYVRNETELNDLFESLKKSLTNGKGNCLILKDVSDDEKEQNQASEYSLNEIGM